MERSSSALLKLFSMCTLSSLWYYSNRTCHWSWTKILNKNKWCWNYIDLWWTIIEGCQFLRSCCMSRQAVTVSRIPRNWVIVGEGKIPINHLSRRQSALGRFSLFPRQKCRKSSLNPFGLQLHLTSRKHRSRKFYTCLLAKFSEKSSNTKRDYILWLRVYFMRCNGTVLVLEQPVDIFGN